MALATSAWLKDMPKFSGKMADYFTFVWEWTNWLGARYPNLHAYLLGAAVVLPVALSMTDALQIIIDRMRDADAALRSAAIAAPAAVSKKA